MKYIRIFEEYNSYFTSISEEEYFLLISGKYDHHGDNYNPLVNLLDFKDYIQSKWESFTSYELTQIKSFFNCDISFNPDLETSTKFNIPQSDIEIDKGYYFFITKLKDEWFIVMDHSREIPYYKCDQFEGLMSYLNQSNR